MRCRGGLTACALALALALGGGPALSANEADAIVADYRQDAVIDGRYETSDLRAALADQRDDPLYRQFAGAVQGELDELLLGRAAVAPEPPAPESLPAPEPPGVAGDGLKRSLEREPPADSLAAAGPTAAVASSLALPERRPIETSHAPWPLIALSALAGVLAVCGLGATLYRRARRPSRVLL